MKISIERSGAGRLDSSGNPPDIQLPNCWVWGKVECLHTPAGAVWQPNLQQLQDFLNGSEPLDTARFLPAVEGKFLAIYQDKDRVSIFCDRYALNLAYYSLTADRLFIFDQLLDCGHTLRIEQPAALAFSLLRYVPGRATLFSGINRLMPGDVLCLNLKDGSFSKTVVSVYPSKDLGKIDKEEAAELMHHKFRDALENRLACMPTGEPLLLPLSGGIDSRYLLGTALELVPASRIVAMTFGSKGSYEMEFGRRVAEATGVRHLAYPLSVSNYGPQNLARNCLDTDGQISFTTEAPVEIYSDFARQGRVSLSGYVGDAVMGNKVKPAADYSRRQIVCKDVVSHQLQSTEHLLLDSLVDDSFYFEAGGASSLEGSELWFFINHFTKYSHYCVFKAAARFDTISPFLDYQFVDFVLNLPGPWRANRRLYLDWIQRHFPALAALPAKTYRGASIISSRWVKSAARVQDMVFKHLFGIDQRVNKIDYSRHYRQICTPDVLKDQLRGFLPAEFLDAVFSDRQNYLIILNLKCLQVLNQQFGVEFIL